MFQFYNLIPSLTARENVGLITEIARDPMPPETALELVNLGARLDHFPAQLSGGEQQRVAIARALINEPDLILADEPTGNLDSHTGQEIIELLCGLRAEKQTTLIMATHDSKLAARAPKIVELVDGAISAEVKSV